MGNLVQTSNDAPYAGKDSKLYANLQNLVFAVRPFTIIETGTYHATGTTASICKALAALPNLRCSFYSIEVNTANYAVALENLKRQNLLNYVTVLNGLSVPRAIMPTAEQINQFINGTNFPQGVFADFPENARVQIYYDETSRADGPDDLLGLCLENCNGQPDIVLLDSAGHMGYVEFNYVLDKIKKEMYFVLDDTNHIKHYLSKQFVKQDLRFQIIIDDSDRFGYLIAKFKP